MSYQRPNWYEDLTHHLEECELEKVEVASFAVGDVRAAMAEIEKLQDRIDDLKDYVNGID